MNSIAQALKLNSEKNGGKKAIICEINSVTYGELFEKSLIFASNLKERKIKKGSRIVLEADNLINYFASFLGCHIAGCISVPIEKNISIYKLQEILKTTKPSLVFMKNNGESYGEFLQGNADYSLPMPKASDVATIVATTGTTGMPVLVTHTNKSTVAPVENLVEGTLTTENDVFFSNLPFYLSVGFRRVFAALLSGATAVITDKDVNDAVLGEYIEKYGVTHIALANSNIRILLDTDNRDFKKKMSTVRCVESLSGPLTDINIRDFHKTYPAVTLYNVYGTTESGCLLINNTHENSAEGCLGKPAKNSDVFLVDEKGEKVTKPDIYGHIAVSGDTNMVGYYRRKALTQEVMPDGCMIINDIAYFDKDGYFYFVSRVGDIIDVKGNKIIPTEVESTVMKYKGIKDCALVCAQDSRSVQIPVLYICSEDKCDKNELRSFLLKHLEEYKVPEKISEIDKIPRTLTGKIMRKALEMKRI